jgi:hypothetical protein
MNPIIDDFAEAAHQFCDYVDSAHVYDLKERLVIGAALLAQLYGWALRLPEALPTMPGLPTDMALPMPPAPAAAWAGFGELTLYWQVPEPYDWGAPTNASLSEDVLAVHSDIRRGLMAYQDHRVEVAVWHWRDTFAVWGGHAANALRALHAAILIAHRENL